MAGGVGLVVYAIKESFVKNHPTEGYSLQSIDSSSPSRLFKEKGNNDGREVNVSKEHTQVDHVLKAMSFQSHLCR